jgi:hypothetical protein
MLTARANVHRSKLPRPGALVIVRMRPLAPGHRYRRFIVESFPLTDAADPRYARGIHTCTLRALDNGARYRIAGHWCEELD